MFCRESKHALSVIVTLSAGILLGCGWYYDPSMFEDGGANITNVPIISFEAQLQRISMPEPLRFPVVKLGEGGADSTRQADLADLARCIRARPPRAAGRSAFTR